MSILGNLNQFVENKQRETKAKVGLTAEENPLRVKVKKAFAELGLYIISNVELWHDSHPQLAIDFLKLREIIELKRVYNILIDNASNESLQLIASKLKTDKEAQSLVAEYFKTKNQELNQKLNQLEKDKEVIAENIGKIYYTNQLFNHISVIQEKYLKVKQLLHELQRVHLQKDNQPQGQGSNQEKAIDRFLEETWPNRKLDATKSNSQGNPMEKLSFGERIKALEDRYIYENPKNKDKKEVPKDFLANWEWNDSLPWQKPYSVLGRNEVFRIENQRYLGWIEKGRARKQKKLIDCRTCQFRKPIAGKPEYYCSIIPNCNDQNAERFRHGEMARGCNYFKPLRKRYKLHKIKGSH